MIFYNCHKGFNPRAPCGARLRVVVRDGHPSGVSIHAPRARRDLLSAPRYGYHAGFNPRAPCGARRRLYFPIGGGVGFNPRAPCGARPRKSDSQLGGRSFNPRAPCGARRVPSAREKSIVTFQSTRPVRGATLSVAIPEGFISVSIHAPRAGRDYGKEMRCAALLRFNPRAPCGARRVAALSRYVAGRVSIHAPRAGRDPSSPMSHRIRHSFNPRAPCGARLRCCVIRSAELMFQSTRPVRGATGT